MRNRVVLIAALAMSLSLSVCGDSEGKVTTATVTQTVKYTVTETVTATPPTPSPEPSRDSSGGGGYMDGIYADMLSDEGIDITAGQLSQVSAEVCDTFDDGAGQAEAVAIMERITGKTGWRATHIRQSAVVNGVHSTWIIPTKGEI